MEVTYQGRRIGHIDWSPDHWGANVSVRCTIPGDTLQLLRCYAVTPTGLLLIGLPEPRGGQLVLTRHLSMEVLRSAGCDRTPPAVFFLSDATEPVVPPSPPPASPEPSDPPEPPTSPEPSDPPEPPTSPESSDSPEPPTSPESSDPPEPPTSPESPEPSDPPESPEVPEPSPQPTTAGPCTGDSILDQLIGQQHVAATQEPDGVILRCPFAPDMPFALAPAFVLCEVRDGQATLRFDRCGPASDASPDTDTLPASDETSLDINL